MNYCQCKDKKSVDSSAYGKKFQVCSKNLGGCGHEIRGIINLKAAKVEPDDFTGLATFSNPIAENKCPVCEGAGIQRDMVSRQFVSCDYCDGVGYVI